jgi:hypothetical protein
VGKGQGHWTLTGVFVLFRWVLGKCVRAMMVFEGMFV